MKKILFLVFGLFSIFNQAQPLEKALLWKISGNGLTQPSYLFGTIHATCDATLDAATLKALEETKQLYLEIDMDDPMLQMQMMQGMTMKNGVTISSLVSEEEFVVIDEFLQKNIGMSAKMINTFKPFMLNSMLLPKLLDCEFQSVEMELMKVTKAQNEEVYGLETIGDQLQVFDKIPYQDQVNELLKTAKSDLSKEKEEMKKIMDVYKTKDIEKMLVVMDESDNTISADNKDVLLVNRNRNWIPVIEKVIKSTPTFFGVGAAHLAGEDGVIKLLRKQGYTVEAVK
ncbi:TraB/GumN family protein [Flavobacterium tibetense]|uniref:TraB/GumN family protein n=1 Tax=Flavobacterium tibetense TaxID=2233533 RepID=A0A365NZR2_9FLAO|nr:TraB/GumN family protein [Flavobacterium tibetense]RBA27573.1 TraB/GumN family protein [Flavobacterium tibetense]